MELLIEASLHPSSKDSRLRLPIHYSCKNDNFTLVKQFCDLLSVDDLNSVDSESQTPLSIHLSRFQPPNEALVEALVEAGANLNLMVNFPELDHLRNGFNPDVQNRCSYSFFCK